MLLKYLSQKVFITFIIILLLYVLHWISIFMIKNNMRELRAFIYRTYHDYIVENKDSINIAVHLCLTTGVNCRRCYALSANDFGC